MLVGVQQDADGIDLDDLDARDARGCAATGTRVKLLYVVPNFQNPTGQSAERRSTGARLLAWAERHDCLIVEDDPYGALYFEDEARARRRRGR